ncbi:MAG: hypothetical protein M0Z77_04875 [Thermoplasmatales archaeon]|jgi:hypothetical protein|nr:hypothetical protein [Candidatus Thermoplasmatota archaeon]MCL6002982.1 hypothetical protein [Candidatus Thermoplasmatota archaeon]MDA8054968.1 hypothetical protein [Thermoplasmatales archaeon]
MELLGRPLILNRYAASSIRTNKNFLEYNIPQLPHMYLPESMSYFVNSTFIDSEHFIEDDNRGAISRSTSIDIDGTKFYLSVKGIGSTVQPFSRKNFDPEEIRLLSGISGVDNLLGSRKDVSQRFITGELWLRGSPYGGQGLEHATNALRVSEMADLTDLNGFRVAPLINIVEIPEDLEKKIKKIFWYRRFRGKIVQEVRLVPSNVRIFFHSGSTIGNNVRSVFDLFKIETEDKAYEFLVNFVRSGIAFLTLFTRSLRSNEDDTVSGYDFYDVWLDKDAVLSPEGTIYFVDLEGLEWIRVKREDVAEKIDDQVYRSLYEFMYAYEQIERERVRRFGNKTDRKIQFEHLLREALHNDEVVQLERSGETLYLSIGNILGEQSLIKKFPIIDW